MLSENSAWKQWRLWEMGMDYWEMVLELRRVSRQSQKSDWSGDTTLKPCCWFAVELEQALALPGFCSYLWTIMALSFLQTFTAVHF